tara:strand:- start:31679 stop:31951 length:273 start_codon:yes stop_codon:yes gene_type:complete
MIIDKNGKYHDIEIENINFIYEKTMAKKNNLIEPVIIEARLIHEMKNSSLFECEGDRVWFASSKFNFDEEKQELEIPTWLAREKFPDENF